MMSGMKRVNHTLTYPGATVDDVFAMFADPAYRKAVSEYQHVIDFDCRISMNGDGMDVRIEQAHGTDRIPGFAKKLVGQRDPVRPAGDLGVTGRSRHPRDHPRQARRDHRHRDPRAVR